MATRTIDLKKTVYEICSEFPEVAELMAGLGFRDITRPGMLSTAGRFMTIPKGALLKKLDLESVKEQLRAAGFEVID